MSRFEKWFVNRPAKGLANAERVWQTLQRSNVSIGAVLEIGCGTGEVAAFLAHVGGHSVVGIDVDPAQIELARSRYGGPDGPTFLAADAGRLEFADGSFDLVVAQNVFHHVADWRRAAAEIARVLRPGGRLLWDDIALPPPVAALLRPLRDRYGVYTFAEVRDAFRADGLEEEAVRSMPARWPFRHETRWRRSAA